jgi:hypothetical protein
MSHVDIWALLGTSPAANREMLWHEPSSQPGGAWHEPSSQTGRAWHEPSSLVCVCVTIPRCVSTWECWDHTFVGLGMGLVATRYLCGLPYHCALARGSAGAARSCGSRHGPSRHIGVINLCGLPLPRCVVTWECWGRTAAGSPSGQASVACSGPHATRT